MTELQTASLKSFLGSKIARVLQYGPDRVVVGQSGEATTPQRAREEYRVVPTVIFIRKDGWSLGAPEQFRRVAASLWTDEWVAKLVWDGAKWITWLTVV
jgi:hypothetical protein